MADGFDDDELFGAFDAPAATLPRKRKHGDTSVINQVMKAEEENGAKRGPAADAMEILEKEKKEKKDKGKAAEPAPAPMPTGATKEGAEGETVFIPATGTSELKDCRHEVAYPSADYVPKAPKGSPKKPAREYPFKIDDFQKKAIECIENEESVLVAAHTSAGKTVTAEYAIAVALRDSQRVIYTSPIKALSNQKYRDFYGEFEDVGLMTGDVTISPNASCIVMTTEILRSMLYRGSEILREISWVVFDEVHYMRDKERGVVWEETIIMLPPNVHYVFLSATIPNALEFAQWIAKIKNQPCHVVYTDYRPTPLQHYMFPAGGDGLHLVVDEKGRFRDDNFNKALISLAATEDPKADEGKKRRQQAKTQGSDVSKIVKMIMERNYDPVIVFSFSKRECENLALSLTKLDFNTEEEKSAIETIFMNAMDSLSDDDKKLPQVENALPLLKRGIGIHHSGLLPILKEAIEILFGEGLLKCLFATETFAMGINMPAKTVVFTNVRKFDGENFRWISSGEYIQMSGRAGRRGLDDRGIVIMMVNEKMEPAAAKSMLYGKSDTLNSTFHLGYNMLLNLMRVEDANPEYIIKNSFHQFQSEKAYPEMIKAAEELEAEKDAIAIRDEQSVSEYYYIRSQLEKFEMEMREVIQRPVYCLPFLQAGRVVILHDGENDWGTGVVVNFNKKPGADSSKNEALKYTVDVLVYCTPQASHTAEPKPCDINTNSGEMLVVPMKLSALKAISSLRIYIPKDLRSKENRASVRKSILEVGKRFKDGVPLLDPIEDMLVEDENFKKAARKVEALESRIASNGAFREEDLLERYEQYRNKLQLEGQIKALQRQAKQAQSMVMKDELKYMKRILRRLGHTNNDNVIDVKGRIACEISTADELLTTELIFNGVFNDLSVEQTVSLVSCLVCQEKSEERQSMKEELGGPLRQLQESARRIAKVSVESKLPLDAEEYVQSFRPHMMDLCYSWAKGAKFQEIMKMTDMFEGSIVRAMRRLEELLRQLCAAAKAIGDSDLETKFADAIVKIKRDIIFCASLYI